MKVHQNWVRRVEHSVLRLVSFVFSVVSAHAILWFFSALDWVDLLQPWVKWGIAGGFGILGYFVSRGLAHRLLNRERVRAYVFICAVFELVEVVCNYSMAASSAEGIVWVSRIHGLQHQVLVVLIYVVLSIIPVVTVMLAWVDMDLERAKQGYEVRGFGAGPAGLPGSRVNGSVGVPLARPMPFGGVQPKGAASALLPGLQWRFLPLCRPIRRAMAGLRCRLRFRSQHPRPSREGIGGTDCVRGLARQRVASLSGVGRRRPRGK